MNIKEKRINIKINFILLIAIFLVLSSTTIIFAETENCIKEENGVCTLTKEDIPEIVQNFDEFNKLPPLVKQTIIFRNYDLFIEGFKKATPEEQAKYFLEANEQGDFMLDNTIRDKLMQEMTEEQFNKFTNELVNARFAKLYDKFEKTGELPKINKVNIKNKNDLKWDGLKLIGKEGAYLNFGQGIDQIDSRVTGIEYENGFFSLSYVDDKIKLRFYQGTPTQNGQFIGPDGKILGGDKELKFLYGFEGQSKGQIVDIVFKEEDGKKFARLTLYGASDQAGIRFKALGANGEYLVRLNGNSEGDKNGNIPATTIKIGEDNIVKVQSAAIDTEQGLHFETSNNKFTALVGNYFNKPQSEVLGLQDRIQALLAPKTFEKVWQDFEDAFNKDKYTSEEIIEADKKFKDKATQTIQDGMKINPENAKLIIDSLFNPSTIGVNLLEKATQKAEGYPAVTEVATKVIYSLGFLFIKGMEKGGPALLEEGKGGYIGLVARESLPSVLKEIATPEYQTYADANENYIYVNKLKNEVKGEEYIAVSVGGEYAGIDITSFNGKIDVFTANNYNTNGGGISVSNGGSLMTFVGDKMNVDRKWAISRAVTPIDEIYNLQDKDGPGWKLEQGYWGNKLFTLDTIKRPFSASVQRLSGLLVPGGLFGRGRISATVGGMQIINAPEDENIYAGNLDNARVDIIIDPRGSLQKKIAEKASLYTSDVAYEMADSFIKELNKEIQKAGGYGAFNARMESLRIILQNPAINPADIIPGYSDRIKAVNYIWFHPDKFDETMTAIANAGTIKPGSKASVTNKGFYFNGQYLGDPVVTGLIMDGIMDNPPPNKPTMSYMDASKKSGKQFGSPKSFTTYKSSLSQGQPSNPVQIIPQKPKQTPIQIPLPGTNIIQPSPGSSGTCPPGGCGTCPGGINCQ